jgi:hypothetical protein
MVSYRITSPTTITVWKVYECLTENCFVNSQQVGDGINNYTYNTCDLTIIYVPLSIYKANSCTNITSHVKNLVRKCQV